MRLPVLPVLRLSLAAPLWLVACSPSAEPPAAAAPPAARASAPVAAAVPAPAAAASPAAGASPAVPAASAAGPVPESRPGPAGPSLRPASPSASFDAAAQPSLADLSRQVWRVRSSSAVAPGTLYVFLPDQRLLVATPGSPLAQGRWRPDGAGRLTMTEDGATYPVAVQQADARRMRLRSHNPGVPVDLTLEAVDAAQPGVPQRFRGEWNSQPRDCGSARNASRLRIEADRIQLHESSGPVLAALPQPAEPRRLDVVARVRGEGETRLLWRKFQLSPDGRTLTDVSDGSGGMKRQRCGK